jgi:hypothetical protein
MDALNSGAVGVSVGTLVLYHLYAYGSVFCMKSGHIQLSRNIQNSGLWFDKHSRMKDAASVTLAVQTLRNTILIAIFIGGSAFQYAWQSLNALMITTNINDRVRYLILGSCLFCSFLNWANTIRMASHMGYVIGTLDQRMADVETAKALVAAKGVSDDIESKSSSEQQESQPASPQPSSPSPSSTSRTLHLSTDQDAVALARKVAKLEKSLEINQQMLSSMLWNFSLGFRFIFSAIPFQFYVAGPIALLVTTAAMLIFLFRLDHSSTNLSQTLKLTTEVSRGQSKDG